MQEKRMTEGISRKGYIPKHVEEHSLNTNMAVIVFDVSKDRSESVA